MEETERDLRMMYDEAGLDLSDLESHAAEHIDPTDLHVDEHDVNPLV